MWLNVGAVGAEVAADVVVCFGAYTAEGEGNGHEAKDGFHESVVVGMWILLVWFCSLSGSGRLPHIGVIAIAGKSLTSRVKIISQDGSGGERESRLRRHPSRSKLQISGCQTLNNA